MVELDETPKEVTVMVYVDGVLHNSCTRHLPAYAVDYASQAAVIQIDDPDLDAARDQLEDEAK